MLCRILKIAWLFGINKTTKWQSVFVFDDEYRCTDSVQMVQADKFGNAGVCHLRGENLSQERFAIILYSL